MLLALILIFSISAIQASDVNITDSDNLTNVSDGNIEIESSHDLESVNSNTFSTNNDDTSLKQTAKNQTELISHTNITYKESYSVTLKDSDNNDVLENSAGDFVINSVNYTANTDGMGVASADLSLNPDKYAANTYFIGDDVYEASNNLTNTLEVSPTIIADDVTKYYKGSTQYSATFLDSNRNALANRNVTITVNGKTYTRKTNATGVANLSVDLKPGTYKVLSTNPDTGYKLTTSFKILSTISASNLNKLAGDNKKFKAKFFKSNGEALANTYIKFKLKGKIYKVKTDTNGKASLSVKKLKKGTYKIVCYNKDGLTKTYKIKVYNKVSTKLSTRSYTFFKNETKKINVTLTSSLDYSPVSGKYIKITVNGKSYYKKTNTNGVASLKLPSLKKGVYKVKFIFSGNTHYKKSSVSKYVVVITTSDPTLTVKSTKTFGYGAGTSFKVSVTAGGVALVKKAVTFEVNNKTYVKSTDSSGIAFLPIKLDIGNYTVKYSIDNDSRVNAKSSSTPITVKLRVNTSLKWKSGTSFSESSQTFKVVLTDSKGKAISGQTVKLTIKSKTYSAKTSSKGYATFKTSIAVGSYKVTVKFKGTNNYVGNSTSKSIEITYSKSVKGVNEKNTIKDLSSYLKSSSNCQVGNSKIKKLVKSLTSGLTSDYDKATAIFNYVRDHVSYSFYYDTKYGAVGTLNAKKGNCVDHSHLLVAMYRTAGLAARYVHGTCRFSSGSSYGHVWAQVLIGDNWVCADATSYRNSLGQIVNWNTKSYSLHSTYASLPF